MGAETKRLYALRKVRKECRDRTGIEALDWVIQGLEQLLEYERSQMAAKALVEPENDIRGIKMIRRGAQL